MLTKKFKTIAFILAVILLVVSFAFKFFENTWFPITAVSVQGEYSKIGELKVKQLVAPEAAKGFFGVDLESIQKQLQELPWVESVSVSRIWPGKLFIQIKQKEPIALWNKSGLILSNGKIFYPMQDTVPANLPKFNGPMSEKRTILSNFTKMNELLKPIGLNVIQIDLSSKLEWQITLNNNMIVLLGNDDVIPRLIRFIKVYAQVFEKEHRYPVLVDMRYSHGMAIKWTKE